MYISKDESGNEVDENGTKYNIDLAHKKQI